MIAHRKGIPMDEQERIIKDYQSGMSVYLVQQKYSKYSRKSIYQLIHEAQAMRPRAGDSPEDDPDEDEVIRRRDLIKESWTDEQARARWIARSRSKMADLGHSLSKLIPD